MIYDNILQTIGSTPLVRINRLNPNPNALLLAKLEGVNPTGSIKDRLALALIEQAEADGSLRHGQAILEATSGNTGIGLAMVGRLKGYEVVIVMSEGVSVERRKLLSAYGARLVLTDAERSTDGAIFKARQMIADEPGRYYLPDQFSNPANVEAHRRTTAREIWEQTEGRITHFVAAVGTSGTFIGTAKGLREFNPKIRIIEAQAEPMHRIQGLKNMLDAVVPAIYDTHCADERIFIESAPAIEAAKSIIREEGILVGMSSGAALVAARKVLGEIDSGVVVTIFPDRGEKYLSTELFE